MDEDNGWPNVEGRIAFGLGNAAPIGIGQHLLLVFRE
jgi:hypothetical protein